MSKSASAAGEILLQNMYLNRSFNGDKREKKMEISQVCTRHAVFKGPSDLIVHSREIIQTGNIGKQPCLHKTHRLDPICMPNISKGMRVSSLKGDNLTENKGDEPYLIYK